MKKLYNFHWDYGRNGDVRGIFVAEESDVAVAIGRQIYFGEILGKHSEVYGTLEAKDIEIKTDDQDFIEKFIKFIGTSTGYNPLDYINEDPIES